jgi:hypothetical protein
MEVEMKKIGGSCGQQTKRRKGENMREKGRENCPESVSSSKSFYNTLDINS